MRISNDRYSGERLCPELALSFPPRATTYSTDDILDPVPNFSSLLCASRFLKLRLHPLTQEVLHAYLGRSLQPRAAMS